MIKGETLSHYIRKIRGAWKHFILAVRPASFYHRGLATRLASIERFLMLCVSKVRKKIFLGIFFFVVEPMILSTRGLYRKTTEMETGRSEAFLFFLAIP